MIPVLELSNGKTLHLDGNDIDQNEAIEIARKLLETWGQVHPKAKAVMLYEVTPKRFSECPHYDDLKEGLDFEGYSQENK